MTIERPLRVNGLNVLETTGGKIDTLLYMLAAMAEMGEPATAFTDSMVHYIAETQGPSGVWNEVFTRPPLQESAITRTVFAIEALKTYGWPARRAEFDERIARARDWLLTAQTWTTIDEADRLTGLWLGGADAARLKKAAEKLRAQQRPDGGWAQTKNLESDAFGTAAVLHSALQDRIAEGFGRGVPARRAISAGHTVSGWVVVCAEPRGETAALLPEWISLRSRSVDFKLRHWLCGDGAGAGGG